MRTDDQRHTFNMSTDVYTADNAFISINRTVDYEDVDPVRTVHESSYRRDALEQVAVWVLRDDIGRLRTPTTPISRPLRTYGVCYRSTSLKPIFLLLGRLEVGFASET